MEKSVRFFVFLLGGWLFAAFLFFLLCAATKLWLRLENFPQAETLFAGFSQERQGLVLHYVGSELVRFYVSFAHAIQLVLAFFATALFFYKRMQPKRVGVCLVLLLLGSLFLSFYLIPQWSQIHSQAVLLAFGKVENPLLFQFRSLNTSLLFLESTLLFGILYAAVSLITWQKSP